VTVSATAGRIDRSTFERILAEPTPADLWDLQKTLVVIGGAPAARARAVAREFHGCVRAIESKSSSRRASRLGAALGSAAVGSVSLPDLLRRQDIALEELFVSSEKPPAEWRIGGEMVWRQQMAIKVKHIDHAAEGRIESTKGDVELIVNRLAWWPASILAPRRMDIQRALITILAACCVAAPGVDILGDTLL